MVCGFFRRNIGLSCAITAVLVVQLTIVLSYFWVDLHPLSRISTLYLPTHENISENDVDEEVGQLLERGGLNHLTPVKLRQLNDDSAKALKSLGGFIPPCPIKGREVVSAINRASSLECKREIAVFYCRLQQDDVYIEKFPNFCPHDGFEPGREVGCYRDQRVARTLPSFHDRVNTTDQCVAACKRSSAVYAGLQYGGECWCGDDEPPASAAVGDGSAGCNMACRGSPSHDTPAETCGGYLANQLYETGRAPFRLRTAVSEPSVDNTRGDSHEDEQPQRAEDVRIAFLLTLNGRDIRQVRRLLKMIYHQRHCYLLHVDSRQHFLYQRLIPLVRALDNVWLVDERHSAIWGGTSLLHTLLASMHQLLSIQCHWHYVLNLSESDLPVKPLYRLERYLTANMGSNFLKSHGQTLERFVLKQGLNHSFYECDRHLWRLGVRRLPVTALDGGSDWVCLHRSFVDYLMNGSDRLLQAARVFFNHTLLPAESFFHTVLRSSRLCHTMVNNNLRLTNWRRARGCHCQHKYAVDWCGCSPNNLRPEDVKRLRAFGGRPIYFARKFESAVSHEMVNIVDEWLHGPVSSELPGWHRHWLNIYERHVDDEVVVSAEDVRGGRDEDTLYSLLLSVGRWSLIEGNSRYCNISNVSHNRSLPNGAVVEKEGSVLAAHLLRGAGDVTIGVVVRVLSSDGAVYEALVQIPQPAKITESTDSLDHTSPIPSAESGSADLTTDRLTTLVIGSDYDQKEAVFRNWAGALGLFSTPVVRHSWRAGAPINVALVTVDPAGVVARADLLSLNASARDGLSRLAMRQPLLPGVWKLNVYWSKPADNQQQQQKEQLGLKLVMSANFTVLPLQSWRRQTRLFTSDMAQRVHGGPQLYDGYTDDSARLARFQPLVQKLPDVVARTAGLHGRALAAWADQLVTNSYRLLRLCVTRASLGKVCPDTGVRVVSPDVCELTDWSSLSPDPKSEYHGLSDSGRMIRLPDD